MPMQEVAGAVRRIAPNLDTLAAIGARLSLTDPSGMAPEIVAALDDVLAAAGITEIDTLEPQQRAGLAGLIRTSFAQAIELLENPARDSGWTYTDPTLLEGIGRASMMIPTLLATHDELNGVTSFLDIGTGVGLLAVSAANVWPNCSVVGIDIWEPSLDRARQNVKAAGLEHRIELRQQNIVEVDDVDRFDCVWVPSLFFGRETLEQALPRIFAATRPGGRVVLAYFEPPDDPLALASSRLRTIRDGGATLDGESAAALLREAGGANVHPLPRTVPIPVSFVVAERG